MPGPGLTGAGIPSPYRTAPDSARGRARAPASGMQAGTLTRTSPRPRPQSRSALRRQRPNGGGEPRTAERCPDRGSTEARHGGRSTTGIRTAGRVEPRCLRGPELGSWPPGLAWLLPPDEGMTWGWCHRAPKQRLPPHKGAYAAPMSDVSEGSPARIGLTDRQPTAPDSPLRPSHGRTLLCRSCIHLDYRPIGQCKHNRRPHDSWGEQDIPIGALPLAVST
ncbi:hypothetical protein GCM10009731_24630 [Streptomyces globosus]